MLVSVNITFFTAFNKPPCYYQEEKKRRRLHESKSTGDMQWQFITQQYHGIEHQKSQKCWSSKETIHSSLSRHSEMRFTCCSNEFRPSHKGTCCMRRNTASEAVAPNKLMWRFSTKHYPLPKTTSDCFKKLSSREKRRTSFIKKNVYRCRPSSKG
jgi:hypothetical protein